MLISQRAATAGTIDASIDEIEYPLPTDIVL